MSFAIYRGCLYSLGQVPSIEVKDVKLAIVVFAVSVSLSAFCQDSKPPVLPPGYKLEQCTQAELDKCRNKAKEWQAWADENVPKHDALLQDYDQLKRDYDNLQRANTFGEYGAAIVIAIGAFGIGLGIGLVNKLAQVWWRHPPSKAKKQLTVMIAGSVWLTVAAIIGVLDSNLSKHPINLLVSVFIYSLPALLFGGIALWWFNRAEPTVIKTTIYL